jgi:hypothetical protein
VAKQTKNSRINNLRIKLADFIIKKSIGYNDRENQMNEKRKVKS